MHDFVFKKRKFLIEKVFRRRTSPAEIIHFQKQSQSANDEDDDVVGAKRRALVASHPGIARAVFHVNVPRARTQEAVTLVSVDPGLSQERTSANVAPLTVHFLSYFATHRRLVDHVRTTVVIAVHETTRRVVVGIGASRIFVRFALPALYG